MPQDEARIHTNDHCKPSLTPKKHHHNTTWATILLSFLFILHASYMLWRVEIIHRKMEVNGERVRDV
jgi:hypothetical protein